MRPRSREEHEDARRRTLARFFLRVLFATFASSRSRSSWICVSPAPSRGSNPVQFSRLLAQVPQQRLSAEGLACHLLDELRRGVALPLRVDVLAQPAEQGGEVAAGEL